MGTKLTLNIDDSIIRRAKRFARARDKSLSKVIEQYLDFVTENELPPAGVTATVSKLADELTPTLSDDELKLRYLQDKYLRA